MISAVGALSTGPARADDSDAAHAEAFFREGRAAFAAGDLPRACAKFAESKALDPAAGTLLNLANCYEQRGMVASAWQTYKEAAVASSARHRPDWERDATARATMLRDLLPMLTITASDGSNVTVSRDGEIVPAADLGHAMPVDPGSHTIEASSPGKRTWSGRVTLGKRSAITVEIPTLIAGDVPTAPVEIVAPPGLPSPQSRAESPPQQGGVPWRTIGWSAMVVGGTALVAGGITGGLAISNLDTAKDHCAHYPSGCDKAGDAANERARTFARISDVALLGGLALSVAALWLILSHPGSVR